MQTNIDVQRKVTLRVQFGMALFGLSIALPVIGVPLITALGLPPGTTAMLSGVMFAGGELIGIIAVGVMGKSGYTTIVTLINRFLKEYAPPTEVSRSRYTVGLWMFSTPLVLGWVSPYAASFLPVYEGNEIIYAIVGDLILLSSFFVLGGDFWDKVRSLYIHGAKAILPSAAR